MDQNTLMKKRAKKVLMVDVMHLKKRSVALIGKLLVTFNNNNNRSILFRMTKRPTTTQYKERKRGDQTNQKKS